MKIQGWAAKQKGGMLEKFEFAPPAMGDFDVTLEVLACGICQRRSLIDNDWGISTYPLVPGHEILGKVVSRGKHAVVAEGAVVGVGWQRSACGHCHDCLTQRDNMCDEKVATCVKHPGGYADFHVTDSRYCFPMPKGADTAAHAPLLCGGATVFSPLVEFVREPAAHIGVVAIGGLGHLAVKLAAAMGHEVTVFSSSPTKEKEAKDMGAHHFVTSREPGDIERVGRQLDMVLVTANVDLPWTSYLRTLRTDGTLCFVGIPPSAFPTDVNELLDKRLRVAGSPIASRARIGQMLELCARHDIAATVETFPMERANEALKHVRANKARYRAVLTR